MARHIKETDAHGLNWHTISTQSTETTRELFAVLCDVTRRSWNLVHWYKQTCFSIDQGFWGEGYSSGRVSKFHNFRKQPFNSVSESNTYMMVVLSKYMLAFVPVKYWADCCLHIATYIWVNLNAIQKCNHNSDQEQMVNVEYMRSNETRI